MEYRLQYPALLDKTYFNYGGQGVLSWAVLDKIRENFVYTESEGPFSQAANDWVTQETNLLKELISRQLQVTASSITLTENVTHGCNIALWSLDWNPGDRLLISECEHPSIWAIAHCLRTRFGVEIDVFPILSSLNVENSDGYVIKAIEKNLQLKTRMIAISHICWNTGQVLPLKDIVKVCHDRNVLVAVDAAQSVGVLPLSLLETEVDFYAFTGHKWWCGAVGVGGLYIRSEIFTQLKPTFSGWRSAVTADSERILWRQDGQKFEIASSAYPLYGALREAISIADIWGNQTQRFERICELSDYLWQCLDQSSNVTCLKNLSPRSGLVAFKVPGNSAQIAQELETVHKVMIRSISYPDCLRASVHYLTTVAEIDKLVMLLQKY